MLVKVFAYAVGEQFHYIWVGQAILRAADGAFAALLVPFAIDERKVLWMPFGGLPEHRVLEDVVQLERDGAAETEPVAAIVSGVSEPANARPPRASARHSVIESNRFIISFSFQVITQIME